MGRRRFGREFKIESVRLIKERGVSVAQAARGVDVHENVLRKWVKEFSCDPVQAFPGHGQMKPGQLEIERLRREVAKLKAERDILEKSGKGAARLDDLRRRVDSAPAEVLPMIASKAIGELFAHLDNLAERVEAVEAEIVVWHKGSEASQRLGTVPGIGPLTASALVASVGDARQFRSSRHFAAWLGLTPRMASSGEKQRIGRISKGGDRYLRTLLIHGARAIIGAFKRPNLKPRPWLSPLLARRPVPVAATALAHKTARAVGAMLFRGETYRRHEAHAA